MFETELFICIKMDLALNKGWYAIKPKQTNSLQSTRFYHWYRRAWTPMIKKVIHIIWTFQFTLKGCLSWLLCFSYYILLIEFVREIHIKEIKHAVNSYLPWDILGSKHDCKLSWLLRRDEFIFEKLRIYSLVTDFLCCVVWW